MPTSAAPTDSVMKDASIAGPRNDPSAAAVLRDQPPLLDTLARAALTSHVSSAAARARGATLPEACRLVQEIFRLAWAANNTGEDHAP
jgi:hypothetical protein